MASLKEMRNRIASVKATRKITKAMQMVAAAKLRRAQEAAQAARPYAERMATVLGSIASKVADKGGASPLLVGTGKDQVHLLIVMTAERGLCGGFNSNIAKLARADAQRLIASGKTVKIMTVGRKGADNLRRDLGKNYRRAQRFPGRQAIDLRPCRRRGAESARDVRSRRVRRRNALLLRIQVGDFAKADGAAAHSRQVSGTSSDGTAKGATAIHEYEPSEEEVLGFLLTRNISTQIFRGLLENAASEQGSRMSAMDSATRNAGDMINKLTIKYNRQRQANITKELIEIISGAEAL